MKLHQTQKEVASDNHDYRVVACGRQWGKTTLAVLEMIACAYAKDGREIAYFATTYDQARNIAWTMLKDMSRSAWAKSPNESRLELYIKTQDGGESRVTLRGFENVETARGQQFDFLVLDEVAQMRNFIYAWQAVLEPTLAFRKGKALFISTPLGYNHFYDHYQKGQVESNVWKSWRFISEQNPFLPKSRIEQAKLELTEDYFAQEYMADFRKATGLAYKSWDRNIHLIPDFDIPSNWQRGRGFDFGSAHFTATSRIAIHPAEDVWIVENSYMDGNKSISQHAEVIKAQDYGYGFVVSYGDPSGGQWFTDFLEHNVTIQKANKEVGQGSRGWVEYCVEKVNERLKPVMGRNVEINNVKIENCPGLLVLDNELNKPFIKQIENLKWRKTTSGEIVPVLDEADDPTGGHYDLMSALRYFAVSYNKPTDAANPPPDEQRFENWGWSSAKKKTSFRIGL